MTLDDLLQQLNSGEVDQRLRAMYRIGILGDPAAIPALQQAFENDPLADLRSVAKAAAQHIQETRSLDAVKDAEADLRWTRQFVEFVDKSPKLMIYDISDLANEVSQQGAAILQGKGAAPAAETSPTPEPAAPAAAGLGGILKGPSPTAPPPPQEKGKGETKQVTGVYEMLWDCEFCGTKKLLGVTHRFCPNCGAAQNPDKRYFPKPGEEIAVKDLVYQGADKICPACQQPNSAAAGFCMACGADLSGAKEATRRENVVGDVSEGEAFEARDLAKERFEADMARAGQDTAAKRERKPVLLGLTKLQLGVIGAIMSCIVLCIGAVYAVTYSREEDLKVTGHSWERVVHIQAFTQVREEQECRHMPNDAYEVSRQTETRTRKVPDGQDCRQECTDVRVDQGDGSFRTERQCRDVCTTRYRDEEYEVEVCDYSIDRWRDFRQVQADGRDVNAFWPDYVLASGGNRGLGRERVGRQEEVYVLHFRRKDGGAATCEYNDPSVWQRFKDDEAVSMKFNIVGKPQCDTLKKAD